MENEVCISPDQYRDWWSQVVHITYLFSPLRIHVSNLDNQSFQANFFDPLKGYHPLFITMPLLFSNIVAFSFAHFSPVTIDKVY